MFAEHENPSESVTLMLTVLSPLEANTALGFWAELDDGVASGKIHDHAVSVAPPKAVDWSVNSTVSSFTGSVGDQLKSA